MSNLPPIPGTPKRPREVISFERGLESGKQPETAVDEKMQETRELIRIAREYGSADQSNPKTSESDTRRASIFATIFQKYGEEQFKEAVGEYFSYRNKFRMYFCNEDQRQYFTSDILKVIPYPALQHLEKGSCKLEDFSDFVLGNDAIRAIKGSTVTIIDEAKKTEFLSEHHADYEKVKAGGSGSNENIIHFGTIVRAFLEERMPDALEDRGPVRQKTTPPGTGTPENLRFEG